MHESKDITRYVSKVSVEEHATLQRQNAATMWLTGLSASGKSTLAYELERRLHDLGRANFVLDGVSKGQSVLQLLDAILPRLREGRAAR